MDTYTFSIKLLFYFKRMPSL